MKRIALGLIGLAFFVGCSPPSATLLLLEQGKRSLSAAEERENSLHKKLTASETKRMESLSIGFDTDVRLCAAGQIKKPDGTVVEFSPDWVIKARKGYAAGLITIAGNLQTQATAHANALDNIEAGKKMLDNAATIIIKHQDLDANMQGWLMNSFGKETSNERITNND